MHTTPSSIPFSSIVLGDRTRQVYSGIEDLAQSISDVGLEQPILLSPLPDNQFLLEAGGRRYKALQSLCTTTVYHATTCDPLRPGFILKSASSSEEDKLLTELIENHFREDFTWQEDVKLLVKAFRACQRAGRAEGRPVYYHTFGKMVGVGYSDIQAAIRIHDELIANPEKFKLCVGIHQAYKVLLNDSAAALKAELASRALDAPAPSVKADNQPKLTNDPTLPAVKPPVLITFSEQYRLGDSLDYLRNLQPHSFDHIICDPDFAVSVDRLEAGVVGAATGIAQDSVEDSLAVLQAFIPLAFRAIKDRGFFAFFYDLDHHEKLQAWTTSAGFATQRWPIIWEKTDYRSNASPQTNTCKNMEYLMVCRKEGTTLAVSPQMSSIIKCPSGNTVKEFGHPFAKPIDLWRKLYSIFCHPGETTFDPFMGSGSAVVAALRSGLKPYGMELQSNHFNSAVLNIQKEYRNLISGPVQFS